MDGRVLWESLHTLRSGEAPAAPVTSRLEQGTESANSRWRQYLKTTRYDGVTYLDEGGANFAILVAHRLTVEQGIGTRGNVDIFGHDVRSAGLTEWLNWF